MKKRAIFLTIIIVLIFPTYAWEITPKTKKPSTERTISFSQYSADLYAQLSDDDLEFKIFEIALKGFLKLKSTNTITNTKLLTVIDFSKSSNKNRFYVIDTESKKIVFKSLVAHGRNSGYEFATKFSNKMSSYQSSLGFYKTAETYSGKHGFSLRLDGLEFSNSNARSRAIVIHGADYVSKEFIRKNGKLGRSLGCPSLPKTNYKEIIETIKNSSCLFIYSNKASYLNASKLVNSNTKELTTMLKAAA